MMNLVRHFEQMHKNEPQSGMEENESLQWLLEVPENPLDEQMKDDDENEDKAVLENPYESTTNVVYHGQFLLIFCSFWFFISINFKFL